MNGLNILTSDTRILPLPAKKGIFYGWFILYKKMDGVVKFHLIRIFGINCRNFI